MDMIEQDHFSVLEPLTFKYSEDNFTCTVKTSHNEMGTSSFDKLLHSKWKRASDEGLFNYSTDKVETKILPGKYKIVAQLNANRSKKRRRPEEILSVTQPCDPAKFNFLKIIAKEVLAEIKYYRNCAKVLDLEGTNKLDPDLEWSLIINSAPICYSHSLLVPYINQLRPQVVDNEGLTLAIHAALLSNTSNFRIALNSLAGYASVNHLHFHLYYLPYHLFIETAECERLAGPCFIFKEYHSPGFVFQLENEDVDKLVSAVMSVVKLFIEEEIAHNIFITRGTPLNGPPASDSYNTLRLVLWGRKPSYGMKDVSVFAAAVCELAGHVPIYSEDRWGSLKEEDLLPTLNEACEETYTYLLPKVKSLFS